MEAVTSGQAVPVASAEGSRSETNIGRGQGQIPRFRLRSRSRSLSPPIENFKEEPEVPFDTKKYANFWEYTLSDEYKAECKAFDEKQEKMKKIRKEMGPIRDRKLHGFSYLLKEAKKSPIEKCDQTVSSGHMISMCKKCQQKFNNSYIVNKLGKEKYEHYSYYYCKRCLPPVETEWYCKICNKKFDIKRKMQWHVQYCKNKK